MSAYLDAPAGKHGFLQVTPDGHLKFENKDEKVRFVGVVNVAASNFPTKEQAKIIAARMAKFGINLVRIHLIDVEREYGLFLNSNSNTLNIHPTRLDRMDYFIKCLKDRGIYFNFCVQAGRIFKITDGIDAPIENDQSKYSTLFNQKLIALQKDFAQKTIGHVNPYTGLSYADDPAMISVELTNENSLFNGWFGWNSDNIFEEKTDGIGTYYSRELDTMFNNWLAEKYIDNETLKQSWEGSNSGELEELVKNGSFEQNFTNWSNYVKTTDAQGIISIDSDDKQSGARSAKIVVSSAGSEYWHIQLKTNNFTVEKGKAYKISFFAKADSNKEMRLEIMENQTWKWISGPFINVTDEWQPYDVYFNSPFNSDALIVQFEYGKTTGTFWLDSVSITPTFGVGLAEGELLSQKNINRTKSTEIGKHTLQRVGDNAEFYFYLENNYTNELSNYLKNNLNVKCPITFTNNYYGLASIYSQSQADYVDFHMYWDHPSYPNGWSNIDFTLKNKSILLNPAGSTINNMQLHKVKNKPLVLSEYNHAYPYIFQSEAPSLLYAYGSFFDLDGIVWHAYYDFINQYDKREQDMFFDIAMHPVMMTQMLLALPYRMKTIQKAQTIVEGNYRTQDIFNNTKTYRNNQVLNIDNAEFGTSFLTHGFQHASFKSDSTFYNVILPLTNDKVTTETNELHWNGQDGYFTVNNPFWQGATGYLGNKTIELNNIIISNIETTNNLNFAAIHLISLDSLPLGQSKKMILLTSARLENEGLKWNDTKTSLVSAGGTRALCEPVVAKIMFKSSDADSLMVYKLNQTGKRTDSLNVSQMGDDAGFLLNEQTLWYEISNHNAKLIPQGNTELKQKKRFLKIYPNPGNKTSIVDFSFPDEKEVRFEMYNYTGQVVQSENIYLNINNSQIKELDLSELKSGIYFCGFQFQNGERIMEKLMVTE